jgi:altronate dehydratase
MSETVRELGEAARVPEPGDNAAIAVERLEAGTRLRHEGGEIALAHTVLEGHRFALTAIPEGAELLSWGLPFGRALRDIVAGEYACNAKILDVLRARHAVRQPGDEEPEGTHDQGGGRVPGGPDRRALELPDEPTFADAELTAYTLDEAAFRPADPTPVVERPRTFMGYRRPGGRGVGTRNHIVVLGMTSRTGAYAKALEGRLRAVADEHEDLDGIVAVAHTEGGERRAPNNLDLLLRTLSAFAVHPNVGAVLIVDEPGGTVNGEQLRAYAAEHGVPLEHVPHAFLRLGGGFRRDLDAGEAIVRGWIGPVAGARRTEEPLSALRIALQCGGSDAFSGVSANPLVGWVAHETTRHGGAAVLAETDELIGAESYLLQRVRDLDTARRFLAAIERFKERVGWHGHTAEGNPSGGNNYRGLYNISIKSIGAAAKRDPRSRLEAVVEYAERTQAPGYLFMDSPGNDLESVAGQVATGCNLVFFTTGNGSITNFPFVPTLKVVTTTSRYELLSQEMDVNAGAYLDGVPMDRLGAETFDLAVRTASGERSVGEKAGHSQVQIWRDWKQTSAADLERILALPEPAGEPLALAAPADSGDLEFTALRTERGPAADQVGLVLPTSLCSGQIALMIAERLNERGLGAGKLTRFVALPHTEGCGNSGGASLDLYSRTLLGHLDHGLVRYGLLLEHGCEKTHNDYFRDRLSEAGLDPARFGWASVQLDGGIEKVADRVGGWFADVLADAEPLAEEPAALAHLRLGMLTDGPVPDAVAGALAAVARTVVGAGGTVVVPESAALLGAAAWRAGTVDDGALHVTLAHGQAPVAAGLHVMEAPTSDPTECVTGLGATGAEVMLAHVAGRPLQAHRMVPLVQASADTAFAEDLDVVLDGDPARWPGALLGAVIDVASRRTAPKGSAQGNVGFQITRGLLGVSM